MEILLNDLVYRVLTQLGRLSQIDDRTPFEIECIGEKAPLKNQICLHAKNCLFIKIYSLIINVSMKVSSYI
jgi:hypothetical protein